MFTHTSNQVHVFALNFDWFTGLCVSLFIGQSVYFGSSMAILNNKLSTGISYRGILVYNICLISISNSVSDGATNKSVLNIKRS